MDVCYYWAFFLVWECILKKKTTTLLCCWTHRCKYDRDIRNLTRRFILYFFFFFFFFCWSLSWPGWLVKRHGTQYCLYNINCVYYKSVCLFHCSIEAKRNPNHDGASSTVPRRNLLQWERLVMPVTLDISWTPSGPSRLILFSSENKTFFHLSVSHVCCSLAKSKRAGLWCERRRGLWSHFLLFKPLSRRCLLMVIRLQSASVRALIWVKDRPVSSWKARQILWLSAGEIFLGLPLEFFVP